jgi:hypothetical protein
MYDMLSKYICVYKRSKRFKSQLIVLILSRHGYKAFNHKTVRPYFWVVDRVARFFLVQHTKTGKNLQKHKIYQMANKYTKEP